jgi:hypothetical protein
MSHYERSTRAHIWCERCLSSFKKHPALQGYMATCEGNIVQDAMIGILIKNGLHPNIKTVESHEFWQYLKMHRAECPICMDRTVDCVKRCYGYTCRHECYLKWSIKPRPSYADPRPIPPPYYKCPNCSKITKPFKLFLR